MERKIKLTMLNEYQIQINKLIEEYYDNNVNLIEIIHNINNLNKIWNHSRIDIKNYGVQTNSIEFLEYGKNIHINYPTWFKDYQGSGCKIEWENKNVFFSFKCKNNGNLKIILRGMDYRGTKNIKNPIPVYLNFIKLIINHKYVINNDNCLIWHNQPFIFEIPCENEEYFFIYIKLKTIFDYFPQLNNTIPYNIDDKKINEIIKKINQYIELEKNIINENNAFD